MNGFKKVQKHVIDEHTETESNHVHRKNDEQNTKHITKHDTEELRTSIVKKSAKNNIKRSTPETVQHIIGRIDDQSDKESISKICKQTKSENNEQKGRERKKGGTRSGNKILKNNETNNNDQNNENDKTIKKAGIDENYISIKPRVIAFWRPTDPYGYFGQWYLSDIRFTVDELEKLPDKITQLDLFTDRYDVIEKMMIPGKYNCTEQFMMMGKAALFSDDEMFNKMLRTDSPCNQKKNGRKVQGFDETIWNTYSKDIVILGNYLKFKQNPVLGQKLRATIGSDLVEGSPLDRIWGVGIKYNDPMINDKSRWKGTNYLGQCLEFVRNLI